MFSQFLLIFSFLLSPLTMLRDMSCWILKNYLTNVKIINGNPSIIVSTNFIFPYFCANPSNIFYPQIYLKYSIYSSTHNHHMNHDMNYWNSEKYFYCLIISFIYSSNKYVFIIHKSTLHILSYWIQNYIH